MDDRDSPSRDMDAVDRQILRLLWSGLTDHAMARQLGCGRSTVHRRIARLLELTGTRSRFALGVVMGAEGWSVQDVIDEDGPGIDAVSLSRVPLCGRRMTRNAGVARAGGLHARTEPCRSE